MEGHSAERDPDIELIEIPVSDTEKLEEIAALITKYSWFEGYPVAPLDELRQSEYIVGAESGKVLTGVGAVNRVASPDGQDNGEIWLADAVVLPEYRNRGIYSKLYEARMTWAQTQPGRILSCTENPVIDDFFLKRGWRKIRDTKDEQGGDCRVYEFTR